jgi:hypothetical protein
MTSEARNGESFSSVLLAIADCLKEEADSCNEYQQLESVPRSQRESCYERAGLFYSLETVCRKVAETIANAEMRGK